jgi:hypothetical protein
LGVHVTHSHTLLNLFELNIPRFALHVFKQLKGFRIVKNIKPFDGTLIDIDSTSIFAAFIIIKCDTPNSILLTPNNFNVPQIGKERAEGLSIGLTSQQL